MQENQLRSAQITSGIVILLIISLVTIFMSTPSIGVFGAIGQLIVGIYSFFKSLVGLTIGIVVCIAYFTGLWLGIMYLVNPESAKTMYAQLCERLSGLVSPAKEKMVGKLGDKKNQAAKAVNEEVVNQVRDDLAKDIQALRSDLDEARKTIQELQAAK